jgi:methylthioribulose-1-phosphate dehydratase
MAELLAIVRELAARGLCPATGGNFSARLDAGAILITASGVDKANITERDLIRVRGDGAVDGNGKPSAETALHLAVYRLAPDAGAVLHVHSVAAAVLSRLAEGDVLAVRGYEMQKAIRGVGTHETDLSLPVVNNSQDMSALAETVEARWPQARAAQAFLVRGHGLYAWGADPAEARRHLEGWEFLLACELAMRQIEGSR